MLSSWELWACANWYVTEHGEDAPVLAAMRCDELREAGEHEGARNFQAIVERINRLLERPGGALH